MATKRLIQRLMPGESSAFVSARTEIEWFLADGTISKGECVQFNPGRIDEDRCLYVIVGNIAASGGASGQNLIVGVALRDAVAGDKVDVVTCGYVEGAIMETTVALGDSVGCITTNGKGDTLGAGNIEGKAYAVALENAAAVTGLCDVWVFKRF